MGQQYGVDGKHRELSVKKHGRFDDMEERVHSGNFRQKSKVPRARFQQRFEYSEYSSSDHRNGSLKSSAGFYQGVSSTTTTTTTSTSTTHQTDTDEYKEWQRLIGERVCISGVKQGVLRYYGRTNFAQGFWCGVELDEPVGKNNGTVNGVVYFSCKPNHGIFAPVSKVSRLNDLSIDWRTETRRESFPRQQEQLQSTSNWDYNVRYATEAMDHNFIKNSPSDPTFMRPAHRSSLPHKSESFPYDKRSITEQREHRSFSVKDISYELSDMASKRGKVQAASLSSKNSSCILTKYGYGAKNQFFSSNVVCLSDKTDVRESIRDQFISSRSEQNVPKKVSVTESSQNLEQLSPVEDYEHFLQTPTNSGEVSPQSSEVKRFSDMSFFDYRIPEDLLNSFQSRDFPDPEDELDNDDQMSGDFDESLGILTPSQMKDFTLCPDLPTSCSDIRGMNFPSSESFDDINDLPEDEQLHDVSVQYLPESSSASRVLEVAKQNGVGNFGSENTVEDSKLESTVSSTDKFLFSISQKNFEDFSLKSHYLSSSDTSRSSSSKQCENSVKLNDLSEINVLSINRKVEKELPEKLNLGFDSFATCTKESGLTTSSLCPISSDVTFAQFSVHSSEQMKIHPRQDESHNLSDNNKIALRNYSEVEVSRRNYDTDSSRDSLLQAESENNSTLKEKLTVSWEDCVAQNNDTLFTPVERPESVYTVASSDTGFQEDAEMDGDTGMATSIDSTEGTKRFSTTSRDSCIVTEEVDGYKIAESNSTSGYSTGLSDSCCNDRPDDDMSSKPLTDEEIQDSVGPCDSEDAFSFHENSLSKDGEVVTAETSDVTVETVTALCHDSTSEALCETMVEDATLTEIHELLMSPEDNQKVFEDKENNEAELNVTKDIISETSSVKMSDKTTSSISAVSSPKSTPEKKLNVNSRVKTDAQRNQRTAVNKLTRTARFCDDDDKNKQIVKSPKKNVISKIKAMIEATSCKTMNKNKSDKETVQKRVSSAPKKSRWEAVTSKIAASLAEEKTKPKAKREIKSRVDTNLALARQQASLCKSPKLDSRGDGSMSPASVSSRRPLSERNSAPNSVKDGRVGRVSTSRDSKHGGKSPRPSRACITSRSNSPVAASESSTSISLTSHNSRSKIAHWKGSSSTVASSAPPTTITVKRQSAAPPTKPPLQTTRTAGQRMVTKKAGNPRITLQAPNGTYVRSLSPSSKTGRDKMPYKKEQPGTRGAQPSGKGPVRPPMWLSKAELSQEIQRLGTLCEARTKELNRLKMETKHVSSGFDAFAALFKYMVEDLNGLSVPALTEDLEKTLKQLELTKQDLAYYEREVEEMKSHHCQELNDLSNKLFEVYQSEVAELNAKHREEVNHLKGDQQKQIEHLTTTFDSSSSEAKAHHEKLVAKLDQELINQREELQMFHEREIKDLEEKHTESTKLLQEHIEQLQKKCAELKQHSMSMEDAMRKDTDSKLQWVSAAKLDLEKEVESLKAVLEMKNKELHLLRVQNLEMEKQLEELPFAREKIKMLQARAEDLEALMAEKTKLERKLSTENQQIRDTYEKESKVNRRLSMENEELQWRLRQAENSLISGSFSEVPEFPEEAENAATSPTKSPGPQLLSRSVFFTFVDKDESSLHSPRSQYKKIMPGFSASYKTSPAKSSKSPPAPSPRRGKSHSEPPQPLTVSSTPRKNAKQSSSKNKGPQKRQRSGSDSNRPVSEHSEVNFSSVTDSMNSSVSSESSVFEHRERLLEEHKEQIIHSLEILREQRSTESSTDEPSMMEKKWYSDDIKITGELSNLETEDMSRSAEFADPKTYYHMTFPVLKESGITDCDMEDGCRNSSSNNSPMKEAVTKHSMSENNIKSSVDAESHTTQNMSMLSCEVSSTTIKVDNKRNSCTELTISAENVQRGAAESSVAEKRWRTI